MATLKKLLSKVHEDLQTLQEKEALEKEREQKQLVLFPIRLDEAIMQVKTGRATHIKRTRHIGDFCRWQAQAVYPEAVERLLADFKAEGER